VSPLRKKEKRSKTDSYLGMPFFIKGG